MSGFDDQFWTEPGECQCTFMLITVDQVHTANVMIRFFDDLVLFFFAKLMIRQCHTC
jgi:hypothetical protein